MVRNAPKSSQAIVIAAAIFSIFVIVVVWVSLVLSYPKPIDGTLVSFLTQAKTAIAAVIVIPSTVALLADYCTRRSVRRSRLIHGLCPACGYDPATQGIEICPECGAAMTEYCNHDV